MTVIKPTVGRIVWYYPSAFDRSCLVCGVPGEQPLGAMVSYVWGDRMVNLTVSGVNGGTFGRTSVPLVQEGDHPVKSGCAYCTWMPYQVGQAKKHEAPPTADLKRRYAAAYALYELEPSGVECPVSGAFAAYSWSDAARLDLLDPYFKAATAALSAGLAAD